MYPVAELHSSNGVAPIRASLAVESKRIPSPPLPNTDPLLLSEEFDEENAVGGGARPIHVLITTNPGALQSMPWFALAAI